MTIPYRFMPWARRGLARAHQNPDAIGGVLAVRPQVKVGLTLQARQDGAPAAAVSGTLDLTLYGPADIVGIDPKLIVRTDPKPNITNFEPNYCAIVDFDPPDFPWLLTPARANATDHLHPWLVLVVLDRAKVALPVLKGGRPLPSVTVGHADIATELPELGESWLWAHTQAVADIAPADRGALAAALNAAPAQNVSRLICPRRLEPRKNYIACVVPATDGGVARGLGKSVDAATLGPAWTNAQLADAELPVYYHWTFSTGPVGDIETLARRIQTPAQYGGNADVIRQLRQIGEQPVAVDGDHLLFDGVDAGRTVFEGAMVPLDFLPDVPDPGFAGKLEQILDAGQAQADAGTLPGPTVPTLGPPLYGEFPAKRHTVRIANVTSHWLDELNLQPRYRLAAGWGAEIVRQNQDEFMQAAWSQIGDVLAAERAFSMSRLSRDVLKRIESRHLTRLSSDRLLAVLAPANARIKLAGNQSLFGRIGDATLPDELFDGAMRRLVSTRRPLFRAAQWRNRAIAQVSVTTQMRALVTRFATATKNVDAIDPNRFIPDGLVGSRSFDAVPLPGDLATLVDLQPFLGISVTMSGADLKAIQTQNATVRTQSLTATRKPPAIGDVWHQGLITETHALRIAELQRASSQPLVGDLPQLIQKSSKAGTEGVLLAIDRGVVSGQALRLDGRSGALKAYGAPVVIKGAPFAQTNVRVSAAVARIATTLVASVPLQALKLYGNTAVFNSLPVSSLGQGPGALKVGLGGPGDFSVVSGGQAATIPTITMPPALKDHATLHRYSSAFKAYQDMVVPPQATLVTIRPVDFATDDAAARTRARIDPAQTVPARLASMLTLGAQDVAWNGSALTHPYVGTHLDALALLQPRFIIPRTWDRVMAYPHLLYPLSRKLASFAPEVFLPGVGALPDDFIMAVQTNPRFVEALMLGANHEMGRELLWQGFPTDQRGTPFQHFWQRLDGGDDIAPIHQWRPQRLGTQPLSAAMTVAADPRAAARALSDGVDLRVPDRRQRDATRWRESRSGPRAAGDDSERDRAADHSRSSRQGHHVRRLQHQAREDHAVLLRDPGADDRAALRLRRARRRSERGARGRSGLAGHRLERGRRPGRRDRRPLLRRHGAEEQRPRAGCALGRSARGHGGRRDAAATVPRLVARRGLEDALTWPASTSISAH